jgi:hypothetical protein
MVGNWVVEDSYDVIRTLTERRSGRRILGDDASNLWVPLYVVLERTLKRVISLPDCIRGVRASLERKLD